MKNKSLFITMIVALLVFISVTFLFTTQTGFMYDQNIAAGIDEISSATIINIMEFPSLLGSSEVILLMTAGVTIVFLLLKDWYHIILFLTVSVGGVFLNFILKMMFQRERPGGDVSDIEVFNFSLEIPSFSFPSGHTMRATILLLFFMYLMMRFIKSSVVKLILIALSSIIMLGVAASRLLLEAHFLSDTIAAMSMSVVWFSLCLLIFKRFDKKNTTMYHPVIGR